MRANRIALCWQGQTTRIGASNYIIERIYQERGYDEKIEQRIAEGSPIPPEDMEKGYKNSIRRNLRLESLGEQLNDEVVEEALKTAEEHALAELTGLDIGELRKVTRKKQD